MTFKFKLTKPIESLRKFEPTRTCTEELRNLLKQHSRLVDCTPQAIYQSGVVIDSDGNRTANWLDVWEYELTERQQQMLNVAGAEHHNLWRGFKGGTAYIDEQMKLTQER